MSRPIRRAFLAAAATATLATLGFSGASGADRAIPQAARPGVSVAAAPGEQLWVARYNHGGTDDATSVAVSPDGTKVFVTGTSETQFDGSPQDATVAYNAATGAQLWASRYSAAVGTDVAVSPDGTKVFITGRTELNDHPRFATVAYNAATGALLWARLYGSGVGLFGAAAGSLAVSPDGSRVVVTGYNSGTGGTAADADYATVAYNAATGAQLWARSYNGPGNGRDQATSVTVSPSGRVFVTGYSYGGASRLADYATVAYAGASGAQVWVARYNGPASLDDSATAIIFSPRQGRVIVTGNSTGASSGQDYATVAYNTTTGAQLWASRYNGPGNPDFAGPSEDTATAIAVSPDGATAFVTGSSSGETGSTRRDYLTLAYHS
jgi:WD40 repeat protein